MSTVNTTVIQVAIAVHDLDAAVQAWSGFLGVAPSRRLVTGTQEEAGTEYRGSTTPARCKLALFELGECTIELMEPVDGPSVWADFLSERGEGIHHIGFQVRGMDRGIESCEALGFPLIQRGEFGTGRYAYFGSERQLGTMVELLEFDDDRDTTTRNDDGTAA